MTARASHDIGDRTSPSAYAMTSAALDLTRTLRIPDSQRSLLTKLAVVSILLFRDRIFAPLLSSKPKSTNKSVKEQPLRDPNLAHPQAEDNALLYLDEGEDDKRTKTLFVPFRGKISKVTPRHGAIVVFLNSCRSK